MVMPKTAIRETTVRVIISGRVQGVWFRGWVSEQAARLTISGWVKNLNDGRVEAVFHGAEEAVSEIVGLCWEGPKWAKVDSVTQYAEERYAGRGFRIVRGD